MPRALGYFLLPAVAAITTCCAAFQVPMSRLLTPQFHNPLQLNNARAIHVLSLSNNDNEEGERVSFLAKALQKLQKKDADTDATLSEENAVAIRGTTTDASNQDGTKEEEKKVESEAAMLRALAGKTRLEAEKMDISLTLSKIAKLETTLAQADKDERSNLLSEIQFLMKKFDAPPQQSEEKLSSTESSATKHSEAGKTYLVNSGNQTEEGGKKNIVQEILDGDVPLLADDKREDAITGFEKLPQPVKDMMAKSVGMEDGSNSTAVVEKLMEENRLYEGDKEDNFSMSFKSDDIEEIFEDLEFAEINSFVSSILPECTRKGPVKEEYVDAFYAEVLGKDTFIPRERKPQAIPGGYVIRGDSKVKSKEGRDSGDVLIEVLDEKISKSSVAGKIQAYYILDPTPPSGEEIMNEEDESPVLLITNYDITPDTAAWVKPTMSLVGLASIAAFSLGSFSFNDAVLDQISESANSGDGNLDFLYDLSLPLALSLLGIQLVHEAGHLIVAIKDGINIGLPTIVPGFQLGLSGAVTPIRSSPKNIKSLFDFAIAGPLCGLLASLILLYNGLELTAFMDPAAQAQLPSISVEILRASALGGTIIDYLLGDGVLNSPDAQTLIKLHPFAISGFAGLVLNALSLLPLGNTDGGRISHAFFGRSFAKVVNGAALLFLVLAGVFGADEASILLFYAVYCQFWQKEAEVPCRNEADELDAARGFLAIGVSLLVLLTLIPLPQQ